VSVVCVCEREREQESERARESTLPLAHPKRTINQEGEGECIKFFITQYLS